MKVRAVKAVSRSQRMAAQTRADILDAARTLFGRDGYSATSIRDIAREAGVSVQTLYARLGSKRGLLVALVDRIDDEARMAETRPLLEGAANPDDLIEIYVGLTRRFHERCGDVIGALFAAVGAEADVAAFAAEGRQRHRSGCTIIVRRLKSLGGLTTMLTEPQAIAALTTLTAHESWMELHREAGLSWDEAERTILGLVRRSLLAGNPTDRR